MSAQLICGDSALELAKLPAESIDLTVTSPPYDGLRTYNGYRFDFETIAKELYRVTKPGGVVVWVVGDQTKNGTESGTSFRQALYFKDVCGFNLHDTMIYQKAGTGMAGSLKCYIQAFEFMFVFSKGIPSVVNILRDRPNVRAGKINRNPARLTESGQRKQQREVVNAEFGRRFNIWRYGHAGIDYGHPAVFPEQLANDHILSWSNEGDTVLDPFSGSGTTGKMATLNGRNFIGIDTSAEYVALSEQRINPVTPAQVATPIAPPIPSQLPWQQIPAGNGYSLRISDSEAAFIGQRAEDEHWEVTAHIAGQKYRGERAELSEAFTVADNLVTTKAPHYVQAAQ